MVHSFRCWHFKHYGVMRHTPQPFLSHFSFWKVNESVYCMWIRTIHQGGPQFKTHNESFSTNKGKDKNILQHCRDTKARRLPWAAHMCLRSWPKLRRIDAVAVQAILSSWWLKFRKLSLCLLLVLFQCTDLAKDSMLSFPVIHGSGWGSVILQHSLYSDIQTFCFSL